MSRPDSRDLRRAGQDLAAIPAQPLREHETRLDKHSERIDGMRSKEESGPTATRPTGATVLLATHQSSRRDHDES